MKKSNLVVSFVVCSVMGYVVNGVYFLNTFFYNSTLVLLFVLYRQQPGEIPRCFVICVTFYVMCVRYINL